MVHIKPPPPRTRQRKSHRRAQCAQPKDRETLERFIHGMHVCFLFYHMENCGILDPTNEVHMFALHHVFLPRINRNIQIFKEAYNRAPLSTERGCSPTQLWIRGMLDVRNSDRRVAQEFSNPEVQDHKI